MDGDRQRLGILFSPPRPAACHRLEDRVVAERRQIRITLHSNPDSAHSPRRVSDLLAGTEGGDYLDSAHQAMGRSVRKCSWLLLRCFGSDKKSSLHGQLGWKPREVKVKAARQSGSGQTESKVRVSLVKVGPTSLGENNSPV